MKLFWSTRSPFVRFVMIVAHEKGLADGIEREQVVVAATRPNADVMSINALNKIPTLMLEDGSSLFDSRVICEYFDSVGSGPSLFPASGPARWDALRRQAQGIGLMDLLVSWLPQRNLPPAEQNGDLVDALRLKLNASLDALEPAAEAIGAKPFDIGHAAIGAALGYTDFRYDDLNWRQNRPALAELSTTLAERPSFQATMHRDEY